MGDPTRIHPFSLGIGEWDVNGVSLLGNGGSHTYPVSGGLVQSYPIPPQASLVFDCSTTGTGTCDTFSTRISFTGGGGGDGGIQAGCAGAV